MTRYEYKVVQILASQTAAQRQASLNNQGASGWELINVVVEGVTIFVYMKRKISE